MCFEAWRSSITTDFITVFFHLGPLKGFYKLLRMATYTGKKKLTVILGSRPDQHVRWLDRQITFRWINFIVVRIRAKCMFAHGTEIKLPRWEVRTSWPYSCEELLFALWSYCYVGLHCSMWTPVQPSQVRGNVRFRTRVCVRSEKELED